MLVFLSHITFTHILLARKNHVAATDCKRKLGNSFSWRLYPQQKFERPPEVKRREWVLAVSTLMSEMLELERVRMEGGKKERNAESVAKSGVKGITISLCPLPSQISVCPKYAWFRKFLMIKLSNEIFRRSSYGQVSACFLICDITFPCLRL